MYIPYKSFENYEPVDIAKLRPKDSYKTLMEKRNYYLKIVGDAGGKVRPEFLKDRSCPLCGRDAARGIINKDGLKIAQCAGCSMVFVNPVLNSAALEAIYRHEDYSEIMEKLQGDSHEYRKMRFGRERVKNAEKFRDKNLKFRKWLDIGCSTGFVLEAAAEAGWEVTGIELNPYAAEFARKRNIEVIDKDYIQVAFGNNAFSEVSLYDVLEHLEDPLQILKKAYNELADNGGLYIYVPNWDSASRFLMGYDAHFIWPSHHLNYFTPSTLAEMVKKSGFEVVHVETEGLDVFDYIWFLKEKNEPGVSSLERVADRIQFFINSALYGKNLRLYARKALR